MKKDIDEILLGFDIRFGPECYVELFWNQELRESLLLVPEINCPLSVDAGVWPSVFAECKEYSPLLSLKRILFDDDYYNMLKDDDSPEPYEEWLALYDEHFELWRDKKTMKDYYKMKLFHNKGKNKSFENTILIAVVIKENDYYLNSAYAREMGNIVASDESWSESFCPPLPKNVDFKDWIFLGYDIADLYKTSGLVHCGYTEEEKLMLKKTWVPRLNEYGLLRSFEDAVEYKEITNKRVPEHAPFFVYKLFRDPNF